MTAPIGHDKTAMRVPAPGEGAHVDEHGHRGRKRRVPRLNSTRILVDVFILLEIGTLYLIGIVLAAFYVGGHLGVREYKAEYVPVISFLLLTTVLLAKSRGLYTFESLTAYSKTVGRMIGCVLLAFALAVVAGFALGIADDYSRVWLGLWLGATLLTVFLVRAVAANLLRRGARAGVIQLNAVIFGDIASAKLLANEIRRLRPEINLVGMFTVPVSGEGHLERSGNILDQLVDFGLKHDVDLVIVAGQTVGRAGLSRTLAALSVLPAEVQVHVNFGDDIVPVRSLTSMDGLHFLNVQRRPISDWNIIVKAIEDYTIASVGVVLLAPIFLIIALAIKLESAGPVIFRQQRHGLNQKAFYVYKFRTMRVMEDGDNFSQAVRGDTRVTHVGRFLRKTSIDELPQLINVLKGEMSIVGPRPHPVAMNGQYNSLLASYSKRHKVKPGMTGWAQINGFRGPTESPDLMEKRVEYDIDYIELWSIWLDLKIVAATPFVALFHENAV